MYVIKLYVILYKERERVLYPGMKTTKCRFENEAIAESFLITSLNLWTFFTTVSKHDMLMIFFCVFLLN